MLAFLNGYKTYIVSAATIAYALASFWNGSMDEMTMVLTVAGALGLGALRHGISNA